MDTKVMSYTAEIEQKLERALVNNTDLAQALVDARRENHSLKDQLADLRETNADLADLVIRYAEIVPLEGVEIPKRKLVGTLAEFVEHEIEALFLEVAGMDDHELSPLEIFRAQQTMISAWRGYINRGNNGQSA